MLVFISLIYIIINKRYLHSYIYIFALFVIKNIEENEIKL